MSDGLENLDVKELPDEVRRRAITTAELCVIELIAAAAESRIASEAESYARAAHDAVLVARHLFELKRGSPL